MAYCSKCGVEVDAGITRCPLCTFPIPRFDDETGDHESMFPVAENIYVQQLLAVKKHVFMGISILCLGAVLTLISVHVFAGMDGKVMNYGIIAVFAGWFYLFFMFGFFSSVNLAVIGSGAVSLILLLALDLVDKTLSWAPGIGFPAIVLFTLILLAAIRIYKRFRRKNPFVLIPIYIFTGVAVFCLGLECILDAYFHHGLRLGWSVIVLCPLLSLAALLLVLYVKMPEAGREKLRRKLHV